MANTVDPVLSHHTSQERQLAAVPELPNKNPHQSPGKVMLKIILNRLKPQAEKIIAEEQAGFRAGRSTTEQVFNLRILSEKYLQHQQDPYHVFIDFKKALACRFVGNHEEVQHQHKPYPSHQKPL